MVGVAALSVGVLGALVYGLRPLSHVLNDMKLHPRMVPQLR